MRIVLIVSFRLSNFLDTKLQKVFSPATKNKRQSMKPCLYGMKLIPAYFIGQKWVIAHLLENLIEIYL